MTLAGRLKTTAHIVNEKREKDAGEKWARSRESLIKHIETKCAEAAEDGQYCARITIPELMSKYRYSSQSESSEMEDELAEELLKLGFKCKETGFCDFLVSWEYGSAIDMTLVAELKEISRKANDELSKQRQAIRDPLIKQIGMLCAEAARTGAYDIIVDVRHLMEQHVSATTQDLCVMGNELVEELNKLGFKSKCDSIIVLHVSWEY